MCIILRIRYGRLYHRANNHATVSLPSTIGGPQAVPLLFPTKYIFPCGRWGGTGDRRLWRGGKAPSCTPRGARRAEFNLEQPYVLWCSVHGQCSRHRTNARQRSALSRREPRWLRPYLQFTIASSLEQVSAALTVDRAMTRFYANSFVSTLISRSWKEFDFTLLLLSFNSGSNEERSKKNLQEGFREESCSKIVQILAEYKGFFFKLEWIFFKCGDYLKKEFGFLIIVWQWFDN